MSILQEKTVKREVNITKLISRSKELKEIFHFCFIGKPKLDLPTALLNKLDQLSLKPQTLLAGILYFLYQKEDDFPEELNGFVEGKYKDFFLEVLLQKC